MAENRESSNWVLKIKGQTEKQKQKQTPKRQLWRIEEAEEVTEFRDGMFL